MSEDQRNNQQGDNPNRLEPQNGNEPNPMLGQGQQNPEPPLGWRPASNQDQQQLQSPEVEQQRMAAVGTEVFAVSESDMDHFESARKLCLAAQITALVSLFFGGVILSSVAVVLAVVGYQRLMDVASKMRQESVKRALKRSGMIAVGLSIASLVLNIAALVFLMPIITYIAQTGDYSILFGNTSSATGSSTWG